MVWPKQAMWSCILIMSNTRRVPQDGTQSQNIKNLKTISRTKALLTAHYFLHDALFFFFSFCISCKQKPLHPALSKLSSATRSRLFFFPPWLSVTVTKLATRWEGSRELPGESAVMVLESSGSRRCWMCHVVGTPSPKIHDQAHYFYHIINPQQSKAP